MSRILLAVTALAFLLPSAASAQITAQPIGNPYLAGGPPIVGQFAAVDHLSHALTSTGGVSGSRASHSVTVTVPGGGFVTGLEMGERQNRPCMLNLNWARIENGALFTGTTPYTRTGGCSGQSRQTVGVRGLRAPAEPDAELALRAVTGLKVCQNNGSDRVKGLALQARYIDNLSPQYAGLGASANAGRFERPNCNDWEQDFESCPNGRVMIGLEVHLDQQSGPEIKGLAPICGRLRIHQ